MCHPSKTALLSTELADAISTFQSVQRVTEGIVDPRGETFTRLTELVAQQQSDATGFHNAWLDLAAGALSLALLNASAPPTMTFVVSRLVWGPLETSTFTALLEATGTVKFSFGSGYPTSVEISNDLATDGVSLSFDTTNDNLPVIGGSLGAGATLVSE